MFIRELTTSRRILIGIVAAASLVSAIVCGALAVTEPDLPILPRTALAVGAIIGLAWCVVATRSCWRGTIDLRLDGRRIATMVWGFTILMMIFFLAAGMSNQDRLLGIMMMANGLAFLIGAAVYWLTYRIEQAELNTRERLLRLELHLVEMSERR